MTEHRDPHSPVVPRLTEKDFKGSVRVLCEIRNLEKGFGEAPFSADRSMLAHWASLLESDIEADLRAKLPELQAQLAALEAAKRISSELLRRTVDV